MAIYNDLEEQKKKDLLNINEGTDNSVKNLQDIKAPETNDFSSFGKDQPKQVFPIYDPIKSDISNSYFTAPDKKNISLSAIDKSKFADIPLEYIPDPKSPYAPQPIPGNPERSLKNTDAWLKVNKPGYDVDTPVKSLANIDGSNTQVINNNPMPADDQYPKPFLKQGSTEGLNKPFVHEVVNGDKVDRVALGNNGQRTFVDQYGDTHRNIETPFINGIQRVSVGSPGHDALSIAAFNAENNAYKQFAGDIPLQQAQANLENANALEVPRTGSRADKLANITSRKDRLIDEYLDPNVPSSRRAQISDVLGIKGDSYDKIDLYDELGNKKGQQLFNQRTGKMIKQSMSAEDVISSNPVYKKAFADASPEKKNEILKNLRERLLAQ